MSSKADPIKIEGEKTGETRWITVTVAMFAIAVFAYSSSTILPLIAAGAGASRAPESGEITGLLLNIALILFAWRRSIQLKQTYLERDAARARVHDLAYIDEVTGLFNRRYLRERIEELQLARAPCALFMIDLDRFKRINDLYGHAIGDDVLVAVAKRLVNASPANASCIRLGGDEFAVLVSGDEANEKSLDSKARDLVEAMRNPVSVHKIIAVIGASVGIAFQSKRCKEPGQLMKRADMAMYEAKRRGRNCFAFFDTIMEAELAGRAAMEADIRRGIQLMEFIPYFQPVFDLDSEQLIGFEVLARWDHPTKGMLEPSQFIDIAEDSGLIAELSLEVMRNALSTAKDWPARLKIAVNVSPMQFKDPLLAQRLLQVLTRTGFPPARLELEISEQCLLSEFETALTTITSLKNAGIEISVDDFGKGYAMITQLEQVPFDRIKIDADFSLGLDDDAACGALVEAVAALGKGLSLPITAEGVETDAIRSRLAALGCVNAQGWLFSKALTAEEVELGYNFSKNAAPEPLEDSDANVMRA